MRQILQFKYFPSNEEEPDQSAGSYPKPYAANIFKIFFPILTWNKEEKMGKQTNKKNHLHFNSFKIFHFHFSF